MKTKNKMVTIPTWFTCCNCNEKFFLSDGKYSLDNENFFCQDCTEDLIEEVMKEDELNKLLVH